jgi:hypothetical protein
VKNFVTVGKARRKNVIYVLRQEVSCGWRRAQERFLMAGWAEEVIGFIDRTVLGRVTVVGKRMGEMNALHVPISLCAFWKGGEIHTAILDVISRPNYPQLRMYLAKADL